MFIKFKPGTTNYGWTGFINAIHAAATATAGANPATPTHVDVWEVVSNTEAGGWSLYGSIPTTETSGSNMQLVAPSGQTRFRKRFQIYMNTANTNTAGRIIPKAYFDYDGSESLAIGASGWNELGSRAMMSFTSSTVQATDDYRTWMNRYYPYDLTWWIAVTQEYLWITYQGNSPPYGGLPFGVANLEGADDYYTNGNELDTDWAAFYPVNTTQASVDAQYYLERVAKMYSTNNYLYNRGQITNSTAEWTHNTTEVAGQINAINTTSNLTMRLGPNFEHSTASIYNTRPPLANRTGSAGKQKTLWPITIGNPHTGTPFSNLKGMKIFADRDNQNFDTYFTSTGDIEYNYGKIFTDNSGQKWYVLKSYVTNGAKRALRMA
jgi:hypothetical protein